MGVELHEGFSVSEVNPEHHGWRAIQIPHLQVHPFPSMLANENNVQSDSCVQEHAHKVSHFLVEMDRSTSDGV